MKKHAKMLFPVLCGILVAVSLISVMKISDIREYGKLINYVGIVRGASQRAVKLEMNGQPADDLIEYIDCILDELLTGEGRFGLIAAKSEDYRKDLAVLEEQWSFVKGDIAGVREGKPDRALLESSEKMFEIANQTVFSIEEFSRQSADRITKLIILAAAVCGIAAAAASYFYIKRLLDLKHTNRELEDMAGRDELTGAYNTEKFYSEANRIMSLEKEDKFAILYVDFENFRYVNDVFGYEYGDLLLQNYARLLMGGLAENEALGRLMADHFVILRHYERKEDVLNTQKAVDKEFLDSVAAASNHHLMAVACGICCREDLPGAADASVMVNSANFAQKTVKNTPEVKYAFYDEKTHQKLIEETNIRSRMQKGLDDEEFVVYFQPKVGVQSGEIEGAEALVRWNVPGHGLLSPGLFIPILEKNLFIGKVDRFVFEKVCHWLRKRLDCGERVMPISVNVSKIQFYNSDFINVYTGIKNRYAIPDGLIEIELTESVIFEHEEYLMEMVRELHQNGFLCSLDDFGSGYSSLGLLKDLPIDVLKMDGMFFRISVNVEREHTIVKSVINMIRELNIRTVAEGVERQEQVEFLKTTGCDLIQGFVYYKPMPVEAFEEILDAKKEKCAGAKRRVQAESHISHGFTKGSGVGPFAAGQGT